MKEFFAFLAMALLISAPFAWITHIVFCIKMASWGFLIAGAIFFPIAIIHGWMIWLPGDM